jgi:hypothetical protein
MFKVLTAGWVVFALLFCSAISETRSRFVKVAAVVMVIGVMSVVAFRVVQFDHNTKVRDIRPYRSLVGLALQARMISVDIEDPTRFEWVMYFLRDRNSVVEKGAFIYYPSPPVTDTESVKKLSIADYKITDSQGQYDCIWRYESLCFMKVDRSGT